MEETNPARTQSREGSILAVTNRVHARGTLCRIAVSISGTLSYNNLTQPLSNISIYGVQSLHTDTVTGDVSYSQAFPTGTSLSASFNNDRVVARTPAREAAPLPSARVTRVALGKTNRRLSFERRLRLWLTLFFAPALLFASLFLDQLHASLGTTLSVLGLLGMAWLIAATVFVEQLLRPLQTLSNVVVAMRSATSRWRSTRSPARCRRSAPPHSKPLRWWSG